jgi:DNA invertase Pin-like site-specific DNA recombinase
VRISGDTRVALYLRVSTEEQDLAGQERDLRAYASARGWEIGCVYAEKLSARGSIHRDAWHELREEACLPMTRRFERVLVWALDRWSREPSFVKAVGSIEELEILGIKFHSLKEPQLDSGEDETPNLARDLLRGILPTIAAFEARRRADRTALAMREIKEGRRATKSGRPPGRPARVTPELLEAIALERAKGRKWSEVARTLHVPATSARKWHANSLKHGTRHPVEKPRVIKGPREFGATSGASKPAEPA